MAAKGVPQLDLMVEHLVQQREQHAAVNKVHHSSVPDSVYNRNGHGGFLGMEARTMVKDDVHPLERPGEDA